MKQLLSVILAMLVLGAMVPGCDSTHRYDSRLTTADGLMHDHADSALALLECLPLSDLSTTADTAYYRLLLTQARYKAYIPATSDSDINRALAYYNAHPKEREKLTRAYIYKGTVMEELGHPDSAMHYYKHAEATADPNDYFILGYINSRIADLYRAHFSQDSDAIVRLKKAIRYYTLLSDTDYTISALGNLGSIYGEISPDSAKLYLLQAIELAQKHDPPLQYEYKSTLAGVYFYQKDYEAAKIIAMDIMKNGKEYCEETQFYYYAARSYLKIGNIDSAKQVFDMAPQPVDAVDSMNYFDVLAEIADAENHHDIYKKYKELSHDIIERILSESKKGEITVANVEFDKLQSQKVHELKEKQSFKQIAAIIIVSLFISALIIYIFYRRFLERRKEYTDINKELEKTLAKLHEQANKNKSVSELVAHRTAALDELYQTIRVRIHDRGRVKKVVPLSSVFKSMHDRNEILSLDLKEKFWDEMKLSVDGEYNGIYTFVEKNYPQLSERDLKIFCLLCANISPQIIKLCMNLTSPRTITNYRSAIIKKKMGLDMSLDAFIQKYLDGEMNAILPPKKNPLK